MKRTWLWRVQRAIKFWWQRRTKGWDDSELWNLDHSLAKLILPRLKRFEEVTSGYKGDSEEEWHANLRAMITSFEFLASDDFCEYLPPERYEEVRKGLELFAKHYRGLWD